MNAADLKALSGVQVLRLVEEGRELSCPVCGTSLQPIPKDWQQGARLSGLECPVSQAHYLIYADGGDGLKDFRAWVRSVT